MKVGLVGLGFMGSMHLANYVKMAKNNIDTKLVAVCDIEPGKLKSGNLAGGNIDTGMDTVDLSAYKCYTNMEEMIENENLDYVDLCIPTYLHAPMAVKAMEMGVHVFCEKPMALAGTQCTKMIDTARRTGKKLMIGHTLRYWDAYVYAKECIDKNTFGKCTCAYFYRGGEAPTWSWENWLLTKEKSGGCLLDQHVHDVDTIVWMFGLPEAVSSIGKNIVPGSGYDIVSTNYIYGDKVINAQDDWSINGKGYGFKMLFRMNFEKGALVYENGKLMVHPDDGEGHEAKFEGRDAYYDEILLFNKLLRGEENFDYLALLESHKQSIMLAEAEERSADLNGALQKIG